MKEHTILGSRLLSRSDSPVLQLGESIALAHHEHWDSTGYPAGLAGEAIPIAARIVAVVDAFDAITHDRPYRSACSIDEGIAEISRCSGTQFDPRVAEAFLELGDRLTTDQRAERPPPPRPEHRTSPTTMAVPLKIKQPV